MYMYMYFVNINVHVHVHVYVHVAYTCYMEWVELLLSVQDVQLSQNENKYTKILLKNWEKSCSWLWYYM